MSSNASDPKNEQAQMFENSYSETNSVAIVKKRGHISSYLTWMIIWSSIASFSYGFSGAVIGGILVQAEFAVYFQEIANINYITGVVSIYHVGGLIGVISSALLSDRLGRKAVFLYGAAWSVLGIALMAGAQNLGMLFAGRMFLGLGSYSFIFAVEIYAMEHSPAASRGLLGACNGIALEIGYIVASWTTLGFIYWKNPTHGMSWRAPFILQAVPVVIVLAGYSFMPESPRWLVSKGRNSEALAILEAVHFDKDDPSGEFAKAEHAQIVDQYTLDRTLPSSWLSMFTHYKKRTGTALLVMWGFLMGGDYFLATYGPQLFVSFGFSTEKSLVYQSAWLTLLFLNLGMMPLMDRVGRKIFMVVGLAGECACLIVLMLLTKYFGPGESVNPAGRNAFTAIFMVYMVFLCATEPPTYLLSVEIFPLHVRTKGAAIAYGMLAITNTWVLEAAATMVRVMGWKAYLLFICITFVNVILWILYLPETKGIPLEEMAALFGEIDEVAIRHEHNHAAPKEKGGNSL